MHREEYGGSPVDCQKPSTAPKMAHGNSSGAVGGDVQESTSSLRSRTLGRILARAGDPGDALDVSWDEPIDRTRWFVCPTVTPLYYAPIYAELNDDERLHYNQLTAIYFNELIAYFETSFAASVLAALGRADSSRSEDPQFAAALRQFIADEQEHTRWWQQLTRLSALPNAGAESRAIFRASRPMRWVLGTLAARPRMFPAVFWIMLVLEERSLDISRRCLRLDPDSIEPRYREVYRKHLEHEAAHVVLDCELLARYYAPRSPAVRRFNASLFRTVVGRFLLSPVRGGASVVQRLVEERPALASRRPAMLAQLQAVGGSPRYHEMMYSRESTPTAFSLFDQHPEMHPLEKTLQGYSPRTCPGLS